ncbi:MAG TPA: ABC transporter ATP-binding protein [Acidimicrobiales bacterium]|nr:ABC transporter ATP-binding protein [Acidimicrobiales bacterium]
MFGLTVIGIGASLLVPFVAKAVVDGPIRDGDRGALVLLVGLGLALGAFEALLAFWRRYVLTAVANGMETTMRNDLYAHLQRLQVSFHDQWQSGQLLSRAMSDIAVIRRFFGFGLIFLVVNVLTFVAVIGLLMRLHMGLALVTAFSAVPILWLSILFEREYWEVSRRVQDQQGEMTTTIEEAATGIRVIKAFGRGDLMGLHFAKRVDTLYASSMDSVRLRAKFWSVLGIVPKLTQAAILLGGGLAVGNGSLSVGGLIAFFSLLTLLIWPIEALGWILAMAEEAETASARIFEVLDTEPTVFDRPDARPMAESTGRLRLEDVSFRYPGEVDPEGRPHPDGPWILRNVDLDIAPGETLALVGMTGSGKTTLVSLASRLYDVTTGRVTLDGVDVRDITLASLRRQVSMAFEEPILFSASARENLLLGYPDATDDDIARALDTAQAGFVHDLPWGLDTRVGEQGLSLSGGQRQRLALARAIIGRPRVLVLDDPLSALDVHTEALVESALRRVLDGVTALLVVHRPSTLALADRVALLDGGTIAAVGTHSELMELPGYRAILSQEAEDLTASASTRESEVA